MTKEMIIENKNLIYIDDDRNEFTWGRTSLGDESKYDKMFMFSNKDKDYLYAFWRTGKSCNSTFPKPIRLLKIKK